MVLILSFQKYQIDGDRFVLSATVGQLAHISLVFHLEDMGAFFAFRPVRLVKCYAQPTVERSEYHAMSSVFREQGLFLMLPRSAHFSSRGFNTSLRMASVRCAARKTGCKQNSNQSTINLLFFISSIRFNFLTFIIFNVLPFYC